MYLIQYISNKLTWNGDGKVHLYNMVLKILCSKQLFVLNNNGSLIDRDNTTLYQCVTLTSVIGSCI